MLIILFEFLYIISCLMNYKIKKNYCSICTEPNYETKILLASLKTILNKKLGQNIQEFNLQTQKTEKESLEKILEIIYGRSNFMAPITMKCTHTHLFERIRRKLKCSPETLKKLIESLIYELGERNYQLDLLDKQLSTITSRILRNGINQVSQSKQMTEKKKTKKEDQIKTSVKIEEVDREPPNNDRMESLDNICFMPFCFPMGNQLRVFRPHHNE